MAQYVVSARRVGPEEHHGRGSLFNLLEAGTRTHLELFQSLYKA